MLADVLRDARYGVRQLTKSPGFAVVATSVFSVGFVASFLGSVTFVASIAPQLRARHPGTSS